MSKIVTKEEFKVKIRPQLKSEGKSIALCHGVFDLVHPGHIVHLKQGKASADILVVSITAARYVRKGPGRPYYDDSTRLQVLSELECVDYVILSEGYTVDDVVESVEPDFYVKGSEYKDEEADVTGKIREERLLVEQHGGKILYTTGDVFSSTKLINTVMGGLPEDVRSYMMDFKTKYTFDDIQKDVERVQELKILVVGDVIIDKYTYCNVQGMMSKDMGYSARLSKSEEYLGGAIAIARHLSSFSPNVTLLSMIGNEVGREQQIVEALEEKMQVNVTCSSTFPTIVKHRYIWENTKREEYQKIFAINNIPMDVKYSESEFDIFERKLDAIIEEFDVVFLCDFGHGLINANIKELIQKKAKYLVLNCQTNSSNKGFNIITKYSRADAFTLDQQELKLAYPEYALDEEKGLQCLREKLGGMGWLTRGSSGAWGIEQNTVYDCPALTLNVKDTIGAGDAFFALAGVFSAVGASAEKAVLLGNIGGALGANIVGNKYAVEKVDVLKYLSTLMNV